MLFLHLPFMQVVSFDAKEKPKSVFNLGCKWWRCGESDPGPDARIRDFLHV